MRCDFFYALVPFESLGDYLLERATQRARLESDVPQEQARIVMKIVFGSLRGFWKERLHDTGDDGVAVAGGSSVELTETTNGI